MKSLLSCVLFLLITVFSVSAQEIYYRTYYSIDRVLVTTAPKIESTLNITLPAEIAKNLVDGFSEATIVLGGDGQLRDAKIVKSYNPQVDAVVLAALNRVQFTGAKIDTKPADSVLRVKFSVEVTYDARDKAVTKPEITERPTVLMTPEMQKMENRGKVEVSILFRQDGTLRILGVNSVMPREFDNAARKAAEGIGFQPGVHKKTKKPVSVVMVVEYKF